MSIWDLGTALGKLYLGVKAIQTGVDAMKEGFSGLSGELRGYSAKKVAVAELGSGRGSKMTLRTYAVYSLEDRIRFIRSMTKKGMDDPRIRRIATSIVTRECGKDKKGDTIWCVPEKDHRREIEAVFNAVRRRVRYVRDIANKDTYQHPFRSWELRASDCDDYASLLAALLGSIGYESKFRVIKTKGASDWDHIFLLVKLPRNDEWMALDASVAKPPGWHPPRAMIEKIRDFSV